MAVVAGLSSPSSLQLWLGLNRRKASPTYPQIRFPASGVRRRQVRLIAAGSPSAEGGDDAVSRSESPESGDPFSGWFGEASDGGSPQKGKFEGFVGVWVAGILFAAGITFAALSFRGKIAGGQKEMMKPLSVEQEELLLVADEKNESYLSVREENSALSEASESGNDKESIPFLNTIDSEDNVPERTDDTVLENTSADVVDNQYDPAVSDLDAIAKPLHTDDPSVDHSCIEDQSSILASDLADSSVDLTDNMESSTDPDELDADRPEEVIVSDESKISGDSAETNAESTEADHVNRGNDSSVVNSQSDLIPNETVQPASNDSDTDEHLEELASGTDNGGRFETSREREESPLPPRFLSSAGIPAPSLVSAASQVSPGKIVVPAAVDQVQGQALAALQVLKVIEAEVEPGDICSRREYARWLVVASSILSRNTTSKVYPAMYIENVTELAFDDVTPEDPDFPFIQGLAEAGMIASKLSRSDLHLAADGGQHSSLFSPDSPVSRQDLVSWKMALERKQLPDVDRKILQQCSGYIDVDRINPDAWPAVVADLSSREHGIIPLAFGYTRLFQPDKPVTKAQAAIALTTGEAAEIVGEELARIEAESMADAAVAAHTALVAQVEQDLNATFEKELAMEKQKVDTVEKLALEAKLELEKLKREREEENSSLIRGRAVVESEMEVLSKVRNELEEQLQSLMGNKMEIAFERERILKLRMEAEKENEAIVQLQYELEVERKALSMARAWAEEEAKRASEQAKALEEARERWERHGLKVVVEGSLREDELAGTTWLNAGNQSPLQETIERGEGVLEKISAMTAGIKGRSAAAMERVIQIVSSAITALKQNLSDYSAAVAARAGKSVEDLRRAASDLGSAAAERSNKSIQELRQNASGLFSGVKDGAKRAVEEGVAKMTHRFKT